MACPIAEITRLIMERDKLRKDLFEAIKENKELKGELKILREEIKNGKN